MQNDFVREGGTLRVPDAEATIPAIQTLIGLARAHGMRVVFTQDSHTDGDPEWQIWPEHAREGSWGWEIVDALAPGRRRHGDPQAPLRRVLRDAARAPPAAVGRDHARAVRHRGEHLRPLHGGERGAALVRRDRGADAVSALDPFDLESSLRQTAFLFAGRVTDAAGVTVG